MPSATHSHIYAGGEGFGIARLEDDAGVGTDEFGNTANVRSHHRRACAERLNHAERIILVAHRRHHRAFGLAQERCHAVGIEVTKELDIRAVGVFCLQFVGERSATCNAKLVLHL